MPHVYLTMNPHTVNINFQIFSYGRFTLELYLPKAVKGAVKQLFMMAHAQEVLLIALL